MEAFRLDEGAPLKALLWPGSLLASIAHAVFVARAPFLVHEQSWDGRNYSIQDSQGSRGTVAFGEEASSFVAVFYLESSPRNPLRREILDVNEATRPIRGVPSQFQSLAAEALQYVLQDVDGAAVAVVTSAFWSDPDSPRVAAGAPWSEAMEHGACLVERQLLPTDAAMASWASHFGFGSEETALTMMLFRRRLAQRVGAVELAPSERQQIHALATSEVGLRACRESLREVGLIVA